MELVRLLIKQYEIQIKTKCKGICSTVYDLLFDQSITIEEKNTLITLIDNKGIKNSVKKKLYWWPKRETAPRIKFLKQLIMKYETQCQSK